ncbi:MAG: efflux RND transporter periplasmic adaptor subunit [Parvibaculum sp.]
MFIRTRNHKTILSGLLVSTALLLSACGEDNDETADGAVGSIQAIPVFSVTVKAEELVTPITGTGTIAAQKTTDVGPLVDGIIEEVFVRVGDKVEEGAPLFKTRDVELRIRVRELENEYKLAEAEARNTRRELDRIKELQGKGVASIGQLDNVQTKADIAIARVGISRARLDSAQQALADATVHAPFDGVVTRQDIYEGKFMSTRGGGGGMGGPSGVIQLMKIDIVGAIVNVPEIYVGQLGVGTRARVYIDGLDQVFESEIHIFNDRVDPTTRSAEVRVGLANNDHAIKPGMFTRAEFFPPARSVLTLDRRAIMGIEGNHYVFLEASGRAVQQPVRMTQIDAARVEIVSGLKEGDQVLTGPSVSSLVDGMPVIVENVPDASGRTSAAQADNPAPADVR